MTQNLALDFLQQYVMQLNQTKVLPIETSDLEIYLYLNDQADDNGIVYQAVANATAMIDGIIQDKVYPKRYTQNLGLSESDLLLRYQGKFYKLPQSTIANMGVSFSVKCSILYRLNVAQMLKNGKMYYATIVIQNGVRTIISLKKEVPSIMTANKFQKNQMIDDILHLSTYQFDPDKSLVTVMVPKSKYSKYSKVKKITIRNFENITEEYLLQRESDGATVILSHLSPTPSPDLLENPQKFISSYKYMKNFLTKEDKSAIPNTTMDADELVEMLFDLSKKKEYLDEKAQRQLQKQLGELISMI